MANARRKYGKPILILASSSPRRREFFKGLGLSFDILVPSVSERPKRGEAPRAYAKRLAVEKAHDAFGRLARASVSAALGELDRTLTQESGGDSFLIIAADTIVVLGKKILQKPKDAADAKRMLSALSGKGHDVITGICVLGVSGGQPGKESVVVSATRVSFKKLSPAEIAGYVATGEPMDKAGAYAIQGAGSFLVKEIKGSYTNVVGLPLAELIDLLKKDFGFSVFG